VNKQLLLPKLALLGIKKNASTYFPYILAGIFSVFVFFVFSSIITNDFMATLPHSFYLVALMQVGLFLLGFILICFLTYTNSFLIKRRKKELGLYTILGLEKKHIALMMFWETLTIFAIVMLGGIITSIVFSKLIFLLLLNIAGMPVNVTFTFNFIALKITFIYFLIVYTINLIINLIQVLRANPNELMQGAKRGDKEPKHIWIPALIGISLLSTGYAIAITTKLDSNIFTNFFLAVALVIWGTHYFFTAITIVLLKIMQKNKKFYYHKKNYVTISGMLHRMKKNAASLANICIFSTMIIITLLCTVSLYAGTDSILQFQYPYDIILKFDGTKFNDADALDEKLNEISQSTNVAIKEKIAFTYQNIETKKSIYSFLIPDESTKSSELYNIRLISLEDYNKMEQKNETLSDGEVLMFSNCRDFGYDHVVLNTKDYKIKKELKEVAFSKKEINNYVDNQNYYIITNDETLFQNMPTQFGTTMDTRYSVYFNLAGDDKNIDEFITLTNKWVTVQKGFSRLDNSIEGRADTIIMNGGLLFLGIFFGIIFGMCLLLIMYYKQITEGFDDKENFDIMQKVGMSDKEVKSTITRQILMVFFLPLIIALLHTMAGFVIVKGLLGVLYLFNTKLIILSGIIVVCVFIVLYGFSYIITSKTYYKIVKQMN
jgi:putative ABC transport system permease protein